MTRASQPNDNGSTTPAESVVYLVDDDDGAREALRRLLASIGLQVRAYRSPLEFLNTPLAGGPSCLILDMRMPEMSGVELLEALRQRGVRTPAIVVTAFGDVPTTVRAFKSGAIDVVEKPYNGTFMLERVQAALRADAVRLADESKRDAIRQRFNALSPREYEVMERIVRGAANKTVAAELNISIKTVEIHRAHVMEKMGVESLAALVAAYLACHPEST